MNLYDITCLECSKIITEKYSTSFSSGIKAFHQRFRYPIYAIYGFVRYADEIVDTFHSHDQSKLINDFKQETFKAIDQKISLNPVLHSFQYAVNKYQIEPALIEGFLRSMEMDLEKKAYDHADYKDYIYGSAEVIGLMCLRVFCEGNGQIYHSLMPMARSLGSAFQKLNFLRDMKTDYEDRGRTYFPGVDFKNFTEQDKQRIEDEIKTDFDEAIKGIKQLPRGTKLGVYIAYSYYLQLFKKIRNTSAAVLMQKRIRLSDTRKSAIYGRAWLKQKLNAINN
ncbi:MAG: phytoene/squalene synthase family protein [Mucilaginibacter sp.]|nr:phytoene/squalene synthase family protein [Mucilaginibacter sp.]